MPVGYTIRQYWRVTTRCPVYYLGPGFLGKGATQNVSVQGGRIDGDHGVHAGMVLTLAVFVPDESKAVTMEKAVVRWAQDGAFGVRMLFMTPEDSTRLANLVRLLMEQRYPGRQ